MKKNILRLVILIFITIVIIISTIYLIDMNRMKNNKKVFFSTWGYDYAPPETDTSISKLILMYQTIIDDIIKQDEALNYEAQYISLDTDSFVSLNKYIGLKEDEKNILLEHCKKYHTEIKDYSFEKLKENGLFNEKEVSIDGILIYVESVEKLTEKEAIITVGKYRSGLGAIFPKYRLTYKNNAWNIEILSMAIS